MKVSYQWLQEYLDLPEKPADLAERIARISVDINDVYSPSDGLTKLVVGHVDSIKPHPDSDHLTLCQVNIGTADDVQIVCGAPNIAAAKNVIVALPGARIGNNIKIKRSKMRGELSEGMICALQEIGFGEQIAPKAYEEGIWFLPAEATPGEPVFPYLGMDDTIIDTDVTPNRGDMFSMLGNVNDIAAFYGLTSKFKPLLVQESADQQTADLVSVQIDDKKIAPTYKMRVISDVQIKDSPLWLQIRLWNAGIRPINNVVDVTNYILLKYGQPLHSFDYDKLPAKNIGVRFAQQDEPFVTLDENKRDLSSDDVVVTAGDHPVALAGTMGGLETAISNQTTSVALESAIFDPVLIRKQARRHDLHSESSSRFERGINPETSEIALNEAAQLIAQLGTGKVATGIVTGSQKPATPIEISLTLARINHVLGTELSAVEVQDIFERLAFKCINNDDTFLVSVPARRWDISIEADLLEEIARIYGYDKIPSTLPAQTSNIGGLSQQQKWVRASRHVLEGLGLNQAISYSLTTVTEAQQFEIKRHATPMELDYPMSQDHVATRMSLISGLLTDLAYNTARKQVDVSLYEQGRIFVPVGKNKRPQEQEHIAGAITGQFSAKTWHHEAQMADFYLIKGIVAQYLANMAVKNAVSYVASNERSEMHPGRTANIFVGETLVGYVGQIHPQTAKQYKIGATYVFELNLDKIMAEPKKPRHYQMISKYPTITRDIALLVDENITNESILDVINDKGGAYLTDVTLFDVYEGSHLPAHKKSLAYTLTYQDKEGTLVEEKVNQAFDKVIKQLMDKLNVEVR
ncbi:phenylalanine--tRNA ligase subunit beta [Paucilactobacillus wasatchensis]|uniref:Phenylalanine--tRNA ligase beta subunit n=1 Tax=Paucilactobacillus wasatchensis TaxID=1335616 RepID=A0A0D0Y783_9LACO|nr:phenylalanine--tRNA ligase subunit beta [Paucilactobacillus wasatchensis]KIS04103.1 Phenylalanyl-tRNA synthetase beta chain [Paucilactobacillus wasatchensis]